MTKGFWDIFKKDKLAVLGLILFVLFFVIAILGLIFTSGKQPLFNPSTIRLEEKLRPPFSHANNDVLSPEQIPPFGIYIMGTDELGRDVFSRMLQGAWVSLTVGFVSVGISVAIGILIGGIAGYLGQKYIRLHQLLLATLYVIILIALLNKGWHLLMLLVAILCLFWLKRRKWALLNAEIITVDTIITGIIDIMLCFPSFFLVLTVVAFLPGSLYNIMAVIGLTSWMGTARFVRAEFLSLREQDFVLAAKALGVSEFRIIFRHMMPNAIAPVLVSATLGIASAILTEAGLSFLGFGVPPPHATWGNILSDGKRFIFDAPWLTFAPGIAILIVVLSFNLFGEGLRDALNPRLRQG